MNDTTNLENLTDEQIEFLIDFYDSELRCRSLHNLAPHMQDLIGRGLVIVFEIAESYCIATSQLGEKYVEENHIIALIEELGAMGYPGTGRLVGRLDVAQLPELLASETKMVRYFATKRFEDAARVK